MCGICGIAGPEATPEAARGMVDRLGHRGPDSRQVWSAPGAALGHARLAIVDLSPAGNQPMIASDGQLALIANGEIYNHLETRGELERLGHAFRSASDNEVLLHAYRQWGLDGFRRHRGMFACAIWDGAARRLVLARDRMGIKPVYYVQTAHGLRFASEIKALLAGERSWTIDREGLDQYLTFQNQIGDRTLFSGVRLLRPGSIAVWSDGRLDVHSFWSVEPPDRPAVTRFDDAVALYRETVDGAVHRHLMSDVPVAAYLSAGLDSTSVGALAGRALPGRLTAFTGGFDAGAWYDEVTGATAVARDLDCEHRVVRMGADDVRNNLDGVIHALDEPRMGIGAFSQYMVARHAARTHKVILTGHGGDEFFSGYPVFKLIQARTAIRRGPAAALEVLRHLRPAEIPHLVYFSRPKAAPEARHFLPVLFDRGLKRRALLPEATASDPEAAARAMDAEVGPADTAYARLLQVYARVYLPGLFVVEDKISMAHSLESRTPLVDDALIDLSLSICPELKLHGGTLKAIPRTAMRGHLPDLLYTLPKRGFPTPLARWLRGPLADWARQRIAGRDSTLTGLFRPDFLTTAWERYAGSPYRHVRALDEIQTHRMWMLLSLEAWLRTWRERSGVGLTL